MGTGTVGLAAAERWRGREEPLGLGLSVPGRPGLAVWAWHGGWTLNMPLTPTPEQPQTPKTLPSERNRVGGALWREERAGELTWEEDRRAGPLDLLGRPTVLQAESWAPPQTAGTRLAPLMEEAAPFQTS